MQLEHVVRAHRRELRAIIRALRELVEPPAVSTRRIGSREPG